MASRAVQGVISAVSAKPWKDKKSGADITLYSFQLQGGIEWFRNSTNPLPAGKGQTIKFVVDGQNVEKNSIEVVQAQVASAPVAATTAAMPSSSATVSPATVARAGAASRDEYWANKEARDLEKDARYEAVDKPRMALSVATEAASRVVVAALQNDALGFGTAAKAKRVGILSNFVKEVALDLGSFIQDAPNQLAEYQKYKDSKPAAAVAEVSAETNE